MIENDSVSVEHEKNKNLVGGVRIMKAKASRQVYDYWNRLRAGRAAPLRRELDPGDLKDMLPDIMILEQKDPLTYRFRLAGTRMCSYYGRELRGNNILDIWSRAERESIESLLFSVTEDAAAAVLGFSAFNDEEDGAAMEMLLLPLKHDSGSLTRVFGSIVPLTPPDWLGDRPLVSHKVTSLRLLWPDDAPRFTIEARAAAPVTEPPYAGFMPARRGRPKLTVIDGGLTER